MGKNEELSVECSSQVTYLISQGGTQLSSCCFHSPTIRKSNKLIFFSLKTAPTIFIFFVNIAVLD